MAKDNTKKTKQRPVETLRAGAVKASIWKNDSEKGAFFSVSFSRTYKNADGRLRDVSSFSGPQLLQLSRLAEKAYDRAAELRRAENATEEAEEHAEEQEEGEAA